MSTLDQTTIILKGIGKAISDGFLSVPVYQRSYAWTDEEVNDLLQDLGSAIAKSEPEYFLGSIVVARNGQMSEVVDGQQRLATTIILIAAIRDYFVESGTRAESSDIESEYLFKKHLRTQESITRFRLNAEDNDFFRKRILSVPSSDDRKILPFTPSHNRISKAAEIARKRVYDIARLTSEPVSRLLDWVEYIAENTKVIWVSVPDQANAFTIFETLNDRGVDLAISDLLKNFLFGQAGDRLPEVQQKWVSMLASLKVASDEEITVTYIRQLWSSKKGLTREKDLYKSIKNSTSIKQAAIDLSDDLEKNARLYAAMLNTQSDVWDRYSTTAKKHMATLNALGMTQMRPLVLAVLDTFDRQEAEKSLKLMTAWAVRFLIYGGLGGGFLENQYCIHAKAIRDKAVTDARGLVRAMNGTVPSDIAFRNAFAAATVSKNAFARFYLRVLDSQAKGSVNQELVPNEDEQQVNLEHILPENPSAEWASIDYETARSYYKRIGNLTLLGTRLNSTIGNIGFDAKKPAFSSSPFELTKDLSQYTEWGVEQIEERQSRLAALAVLAWPITV